jgi:hypothetical protein
MEKGVLFIFAYRVQYGRTMPKSVLERSAGRGASSFGE